MNQIKNSKCYYFKQQNLNNMIKKEGNLSYLTEDVLFVSVFSFSPLKVKIGDTSAPNLVKVNSDVRDVALPASNKLSGSLSTTVVPAIEFLWVLRDFLGSWLTTSQANSSTFTSSSCSILSCSDLAIRVDCVFVSNNTGDDTELWTPISGLKGLQFDVGLSITEDSTPLVNRLSWDERKSNTCLMKCLCG